VCKYAITSFHNEEEEGPATEWGLRNHSDSKGQGGTFLTCLGSVSYTTAAFLCQSFGKARGHWLGSEWWEAEGGGKYGRSEES
jgi:hypothetical protein